MGSARAKLPVSSLIAKSDSAPRLQRFKLALVRALGGEGKAPANDQLRELFRIYTCDRLKTERPKNRGYKIWAYHETTGLWSVDSNALKKMLADFDVYVKLLGANWQEFDGEFEATVCYAYESGMLEPLREYLDDQAKKKGQGSGDTLDAAMAAIRTRSERGVLSQLNTTKSLS